MTLNLFTACVFGLGYLTGRMREFTRPGGTYELLMRGNQ